MSLSDTFYDLDEYGNVIEVNFHTGEKRVVKAVETDGPMPVGLTPLTLETGDIVWVQKDLPLEEQRKLAGRKFHYPYSRLLAERVCTMVAEGKTLTQISRMDGMPRYSTIARWKRDHPEFLELYKIAVEDRGEFYFTKMMEEVESAKADRDDVALARLKSDIFKYAAKVSSPKEFSETVKADVNMAISAIKIDTGIRRPGDAGYNADETLKLIKDAGSGESGEGSSSS